MFEIHFGLRENPFVSGHQPRFVFPSPEHQEAIAHLRFGIENREPFVLITGEVGTGKTTALYDVLIEWKGRVHVALVSNSALTRNELLEEICLRLGFTVPEGSSKPQVLNHLERHLLAVHGRGERAILLLDEAQNLDRELLEEIRLLSNLEVEGEKLLQVFLVGQPELEERLARPELRQLRQRISVHYRLKPLSYDDTERYIHHRISVAGGYAPDIFPVATCRLVYELSHGIPREINQICAQALLGAFVDDAHVVRPEHVRAAAAEIEFKSVIREGEAAATASSAPAATPPAAPAPAVPAPPATVSPPATTTRPAASGLPEPPAPRPIPEPAIWPAPTPVVERTPPPTPAQPPRPTFTRRATDRPGALDPTIGPPRPVTTPRPVEPPRPAEPPRIVEPVRPAELPRAVEPPRPVAPPRPVESPRAVEPPRPVDPPPRLAPPLAVIDREAARAARGPLRPSPSTVEDLEDSDASTTTIKWMLGVVAVAGIVIAGVLLMRFKPWAGVSEQPPAKPTSAAPAESSTTTAPASATTAHTTAPEPAPPAANAAPPEPEPTTGHAESPKPAAPKPASTPTPTRRPSAPPASHAAVLPPPAPVAAGSPPPAAAATTLATTRPAADSARAQSRPPARTFGVAVASFLDQARAEAERGRLAAATNMFAQVRSVVADSVSKFELVLGSFATQDAAERAASDLISRGLVDEARVVAQVQPSAPAATPH